jgi:hypothetical protein
VVRPGPTGANRPVLSIDPTEALSAAQVTPELMTIVVPSERLATAEKVSPKPTR